MLPQTFTIATFNLYNLNLPGKKLYRGEPWTGVEYARKLAFSAMQLHEAQADIVGLQELWHRDALIAMLQQAELADEFEPLVPDDAKGTRIVCAAIVRKGLRVGEPRWIENFPDGFVLESKGDDPQARKAGAIRIGIRKFSRPVLRFDVKLHPKQPAAQVYVCHFKSKLPTRIDEEPWFEDAYKPHRTALGAALSTIRRTTEAAALRWLLTLEMKTSDTPVIVLGDVNDGQHSNTANILTEQPRYLTGDSTGGGGNALYTAQTLQEYRDTRDVYYTHVHQDLRESLDHILVSEQFYDHGKKRIWLFDGLAIANDHLDVEDHRAHGSGDHGIVRVRFKYKPAKA